VFVRQKSLGSVAAGSSVKRVLVLSDNEKLSKAVELNLTHPTPMKVVCLAPVPPEHRGNLGTGGFDLLVVATSSPGSEPLVMLARASLADRVGRVPILIISDRPFCTDLEARIAHLGFPFRPDGLHHMVMRLLRDGNPGSRDGDDGQVCE
jgi:hypothetical protein